MAKNALKEKNEMFRSVVATHKTSAFNDTHDGTHYTHRKRGRAREKENNKTLAQSVIQRKMERERRVNESVRVRSCYTVASDDRSFFGGSCRYRIVMIVIIRHHIYHFALCAISTRFRQIWNRHLYLILWTLLGLVFSLGEFLGILFEFFEVMVEFTRRIYREREKKNYYMT